MNDVSRRDAVILAAGLAAGAGVTAIRGARAQEVQKEAVELQVQKEAEKLRIQQGADRHLEHATQNPQGFMFREQVTFKLEGAGPGHELVITSALDTLGQRSHVIMLTGCMRVFRADADLDAFTRQGGFHWRVGKTQGQVQLKQPGALVMIVRDQDDTVHCYTLESDFRC